MTIALFFLMGYQFWGETAHEWIGAGMFVLFIAHQACNLNRYKNLFRGRYTPIGILQRMINILMLAAMLVLMYSGITMSRHVFVFLPIRGGMALARRLHILGSYGVYVLMSLHLGLHWGMTLNMVVKKHASQRALMGLYTFMAHYIAKRVRKAGTGRKEGGQSKKNEKSISHFPLCGAYCTPDCVRGERRGRGVFGRTCSAV